VLSSLTNRIFVASALLVVVSTGAAIFFVQRAVSRRAEADLRTRLDEAASLVDTVSQTQFSDFIVMAQLIGDLPKLRAAVETDDPPTVQPIARDYQQRLRADLFLVVGRSGRLLAQVGRVHLPADGIGDMVAACRRRADQTAFWPLPGGILHVAVIPLDTGVAALVVGTSLDREAADAIKAVTETEIAFLQGPSVVAATLPLESVASLHAAPDAQGVFLVPANGEQYIGRLQALAPADDTEAPTALVLRSRTELTRFLRQLRWQLAASGVAAVLVATLVGYVVARGVTRPLRALTGTMHEMAATGDLGRAVPPLGRWDDEEVRVVAATFGRLTGALNQFQREASARERLASLGRLSAVIAHEIRNPLMIIKSSVRGLRRNPTAEVAEAAASIDEEVARVNRVVTGVLDFARPIAFDVAPANLNAVARAAIQAVLAGHDDVPIAFSATDAQAPIRTDAERLRLVLVNLLTNAQQAVRARSAADRSPSPVRLHLSRTAAGWRIEVRDDGPGIAPEHLPRIFDPFFTTRETGSGLGLAISRNIIEGLGGAIAVTSTPGAGTTVAIDLSGAAATGIERDA
jgi:signal transduction histidine kinase